LVGFGIVAAVKNPERNEQWMKKFGPLYEDWRPVLLFLASVSVWRNQSLISKGGPTLTGPISLFQTDPATLALLIKCDQAQYSVLQSCTATRLGTTTDCTAALMIDATALRINRA
jgi:hypothetical protein